MIIFPARKSQDSLSDHVFYGREVKKKSNRDWRCRFRHTAFFAAVLPAMDSSRHPVKNRSQLRLTAANFGSFEVLSTKSNGRPAGIWSFFSSTRLELATCLRGPSGSRTTLASAFDPSLRGVGGVGAD